MIKKLPITFAALPMIMLCASVLAAAPNQVTVNILSDELVNVRVAVNDYQLETNGATSSIRCSFDDSRILESSCGPGIPHYVRIVELNDGRDARISSIKTTNKREAFSSAGVTETEDHDVSEPIHAVIGRMGKKTFLRIAIHPFEAGTDGLTVHKSLDATIRISDKAVARSVESGSLLPTNDTFCATCPAALPVGINEDSNGVPSAFISRRSITNDIAWKIVINQPGLYRITGSQLAAAGVPPAYRDTTGIKISVRDQALPVWTSTSGPMMTNDWVMFYGAGVQSQTTTQNVYWLTVEGASPAPVTLNAMPTGAVPVVTSAWTTVEYSPRKIFNSIYQPNQNFENWFAMFVRGSTISNVTVATPNPINTGDVPVEMVVYGVNGPVGTNASDRRTEVWVGGSFAVGANYYGETKVSKTSSVPATAIGSGSTPIVIYQPIISGIPLVHSNSVSAYVELIRLCYQRKLQVDSMPFYFSRATNSATLRLIGLSTTNILLLDISDPCAPVELVNYAVQSNAGSWRLDMNNVSTEKGCYALFSKGNPMSVHSLSLTRFRNVSQTNRQADYLVVAPDAFKVPLYRLLKHRYKNDLSVQVASPEDIYNEFSYGVKDEGAIRQYFGHAYHHYRLPSPAYAVLVGNGSLDPLNNLGQNDTDIIPVKMGRGAASRTAIDQWFVTVDGSDNLADIRLGRIPASAVSNLTFVVDKLISYETSPTNDFWFESALLVADETNGVLNFKEFSDENTFVHLTNGGFNPIGGIPKAYLDDLSAANVKNAINTEIQLGLQFVNFIGHGKEDQWSIKDVWKNQDADTRTNTKYPIFSVFTCQNGAFQNKDRTLAEAILLNKHGGTACLAPATFAVDFNFELLADGYFAALATNRVERLGMAIDEAFFRLWTYNYAARELLFYTLFGDPAQQVWGGAVP